MNGKISDEQAGRIGAALEAGRKIEAIKLYREFTGSDLKTAKDAIEALIAGLVSREPEKYARLAGAQGCAGRAALLVLALAAGIIVLRFR